MYFSILGEYPVGKTGCLASCQCIKIQINAYFMIIQQFFKCVFCTGVAGVWRFAL